MFHHTNQMPSGKSSALLFQAGSQDNSSRGDALFELRRIARYERLLLTVAGLGGLLYGVDVGIIAGALPYLEATSGLNSSQLSIVVAAVLLGSVMSTLFAGMLADWMGRKPLMIASGLLFVASIPVISLSHGYHALVLGRLLQGVSAGLVGVVVPLYLAECLGASTRGKGTGIFQWVLTLGIAGAAVAGMAFSIRVDEIARLGDAARLFAFKDLAWRGIFWVSILPGVLFVWGSLIVTESPRWLFFAGKREEAYATLLHSRTKESAQLEIRAMAESVGIQDTGSTSTTRPRESLMRKKYVVPFLLACMILACNQATGVNSIIGYNANILVEGGLSDLIAHWGYVAFATMMFVMTLAGVALVDRSGRKFLLSLGTGGITACLICLAILFHQAERRRVDVKNAVQAMVSKEQTLELKLDHIELSRLLATRENDNRQPFRGPATLIVIASYGGFQGASQVARSDDPAAKPITITRDAVLPGNRALALFSNPFGSLQQSRNAPLLINHAWVCPVPAPQTGWLILAFLLVFSAFYACGPGVCVWLAMSELLPTRIRSNGMSVALLINQAVSTTIAAIFLPAVGNFGYGTIFFGFAICSGVYFAIARFFVPETKGMTLEEIERHFDTEQNEGQDVAGLQKQSRT
jgi:MFS transporter, SP family, solute carrier family 2 (myo-inositol transporter), member 13